MVQLQRICDFLEQFAPPTLAADWDNVGLLVGDADTPVARIMTCLTIMPASATEAVAESCDLIVAHHPLPFRPLKRWTSATTSGRLLLQLARAGIRVYSPHTAFDGASAGINRQLAEGLGLRNIRPLIPQPAAGDGVGTGRWGRLPEPLALGALADRLKAFLGLERLQLVGEVSRRVATVAVGCGAAGELLEFARDAGCDALVLGETSFHTCLEAEATGVALLLAGHFASERFAVQRLAEILAEQFPTLHVWASRQEADPLAWY